MHDRSRAASSVRDSQPEGIALSSRFAVLLVAALAVLYACGSSGEKSDPNESACARGSAACLCDEQGDERPESCDDESASTDESADGGAKDEEANGNDGVVARERDASAGANRDAGTAARDAETGGDAHASDTDDDDGDDEEMTAGSGFPPDGDPSKPMVSVPGLPCGAPSGRGVPPTVNIGGRDVVVVYPCAHEGAAVTFLFTLHGTLQEAQKFSFTLNAGPFHRLADSHNVIYVLPKAVGTQWGRGDDGTDLPHIMEVIDWVYATFEDKFQIRSMWAQGGSWGAFYLGQTLACDERLESRLKGVRMVVGGGCPRCSDRLSCIVAQQELELGMGMMMTPEQREAAADRANIASYATSKGCSPKTGPMDVGKSKHWVWPECDPGWAYSYYLGPGEHAAAWDAATVERTMEEMKSIE